MSTISPILALLILTTAAGCSAPDTTTTTPRTTDMNDSTDARLETWSVSYSDHSGNGYRFWKDEGNGDARFAYDPVTPERSSSGTYSGGSPKEGTLDPAQVEALFEQIRNLEADTGSHANSRMMGTGSFRVREGGGDERRFIIRNGARRRAFDAFLEPYRGP